ncbi:DrmB family protein [Cellulosimicrobium sp. CpK407]|uniref:DrmB family protein n=1 Tax=Cellulosimicrobium sp. CpK407 TaxID=3229847 RepID=UPI003F3EC341
MSKRTLQVSVAQLISPFGPGAIVDILGESFVTLTADRWPKRTLLPEIECPRLSDRLGVQRFYGPPPSEDPGDPKAISVNVARFPSWLFCQTCRRMTRWTAKNENGAAPLCPHDSGRLVPMRFVVVCRERSHATDVPWVDWVHRVAREGVICKDGEHLRFQQVQGGSQGLSGLEVKCDACGTRRTLGELRSDVFSREGTTCRGIQPWESAWGQCGKPLEVIQRGATNFHYGESEAAIDIPAMTAIVLDATDRITQHPLFLGLKDTIESANAPVLAQMIADAVDVNAETVVAVARAANGDVADLATTHTAILSEEFQAFRAAALDQADEANFKTRSVVLDRESEDLVERALAGLFESVILVDRLREVRVSLGFKRYTPDADLVRSVVRTGDEASWLPAAEGFGEGIFLKLAADVVNVWASSPAVGGRLSELSRNFDDSRYANRLHPFSPQYVALHSLAHALLREFSFTSGYSAASLRERVYCDPGANDYGVFVYTTSSDEEGTLGGLVREGERDRIGTALARAAEQLSWCSNDPVCSEANPQNLDGLNLAACHSCLLASETSCEGSNLLLDRMLLVGNEATEGLLKGVIDAVDRSS